MRAGWTFFQAFLKSPRVVASLVPSSHFVERRLVEVAGVPEASVVVELGSGSGGTTRAFLEAMQPNARLLAIEWTRELARGLGAIGDPRLSVVHGCASEILSALDRHELGAADAVISGIPFSTMPRDLAESIVRAVHQALRPGGRFVAYQFTDRVADYMWPVMGRPRVDFELCNIPPVRLFIWEKN